jgi:hypothetical protein
MKRHLIILLASLTLAACGKPATDEQRGSEHSAAGTDAASNDNHELQPRAPEKKSGGAGKGEIRYYRHPMGLPDTSPVPKKDSMGMDYIPVYENEVASGDNAIVVAPETIQTLGVKIEPAKEVDFGRAVRTFGAVADNSSSPLSATKSARAICSSG